MNINAMPDLLRRCLSIVEKTAATAGAQAREGLGARTCAELGQIERDMLDVAREIKFVLGLA